jgi:hypothetical protein
VNERLAFDFVAIFSLAEDDAFGFPDALPFYRSENRTPVPVDTVIEVKRQSGLRDDFWLFQSLA